MECPGDSLAYDALLYLDDFSPAYRVAANPTLLDNKLMQ